MFLFLSRRAPCTDLPSPPAPHAPPRPHRSATAMPHLPPRRPHPQHQRNCFGAGRRPKVQRSHFDITRPCLTLVSVPWCCLGTVYIPPPPPLCWQLPALTPPPPPNGGLAAESRRSEGMCFSRPAKPRDWAPQSPMPLALSQRPRFTMTQVCFDPHHLSFQTSTAGIDPSGCTPSGSSHVTSLSPTAVTLIIPFHALVCSPSVVEFGAGPTDGGTCLWCPLRTDASRLLALADLCSAWLISCVSFQIEIPSPGLSVAAVVTTALPFWGGRDRSQATAATSRTTCTRPACNSPRHTWQELRP